LTTFATEGLARPTIPATKTIALSQCRMAFSPDV
jgi:hypothetical protein